MNVAILRGRLSSPPGRSSCAPATVLVSLEVTARVDDGPADSVPVAWFGPPGHCPVDLEAGRSRGRWAGSGAGSSGPAAATASRTEVVAERVARTADKRKAAPAGQGGRGGAADADGAWSSRPR